MVILIGACFAYLLTIGGVWNGLVHPGIFALTGSLMGLLAMVWVVRRTDLRWVWHGTILDGTLLFWGAALVISTVTNLDHLDNVVVGAWWVVCGLLAWYMINDCLSNRALTKDQIIDGVLVGGAVVLVAGVVQVALRIPITTTLANANYAGCVLMVLAPLALWRKQWLYALIACVLALMTGSRAALLPLMMIAGWALGNLWLTHHRFAAYVSVIAAAGVIGGGAGYFRAQYARGDLTTGRIVYWQDVIEHIRLEGHGLFTYRHADYSDPTETHWHAHNAALNVLYELGVLGVIALAFSAARVVATLHLFRRENAPLLIISLAALAIYQVVDYTVLLPAIMFLLITLIAPLTNLVPSHITTLLGVQTYDAITILKPYSPDPKMDGGRHSEHGLPVQKQARYSHAGHRHAGH